MMMMIFVVEILLFVQLKSLHNLRGRGSRKPEVARAANKLAYLIKKKRSIFYSYFFQLDISCSSLPSLPSLPARDVPSNLAWHRAAMRGSPREILLFFVEK
ncbi:MAG TPA: hypothetical protein VKM55_04670 [Candidatus Lokiarchaeia archaeon]|nr:hypothetical protein [Candidatus Lokiarchaeia archaeon]